MTSFVSNPYTFVAVFVLEKNNYFLNAYLHKHDKY